MFLRIASSSRNLRPPFKRAFRSTLRSGQILRGKPLDHKSQTVNHNRMSLCPALVLITCYGSSGWKYRSITIVEASLRQVRRRALLFLQPRCVVRQSVPLKILTDTILAEWNNYPVCVAVECEKQISKERKWQFENGSRVHAIESSNNQSELPHETN